MSESKAAPETEEKKKNPKVKIIIGAVVGVLLLVGAVAGTLILTGALDKSPSENPEEALEEGSKGEKEKEGGKDNHGDKHGEKPKEGDKDKHGEKPKEGDKDKHGDKHGEKEKEGGGKKKESPEEGHSKFEKTYIDLDTKALVSNISGSKKVIQCSLSLMTMYDDRVQKNVEKHRTALRSAALNVLRQVTEPELIKPEFRIELAQALRDRLNSELVRLESFGGIEEVFFTEFVYQ
jgi:flagellar FliL protein